MQFFFTFAANRGSLNIGLYISELLSEHDYVVLPGFGGFVPEYIPSKYNPGQEWIDPPSRKITFHPSLKMNDGILLHSITQREGMTAPKALAFLEELVADYLYSLDHGKPVIIKGLGTVTRIGDEYTFIADPEARFLPEAFGLDRVFIPEKAPESEPVETTSVNKQAEPATDKIIVENPKSKSRVWIYIPIAILLIVASIWIYQKTIRLESREVPNTETSHEVQQAEIIEVPPVTADSIIQITDDSVIQDVTIEREHPREGVYYVIGGSFRSRENAEKYVELALKKGHQPFHLGEIGKFHVVALASYTNEKEAFRHQLEIQAKDSTSGVWVYSVRKRTPELD